MATATAEAIVATVDETTTTRRCELRSAATTETAPGIIETGAAAANELGHDDYLRVIDSATARAPCMWDTRALAGRRWGAR